MRNQAELLKTRFGSALAEENKDNEIICVPGLKGREPKEISAKNLAYVIQARMEEIIEHVYYEIKSSGYEKKLIAGIIITGGGSQLKHLPQLVEYVTGLDCRVGYPNEHLAKNEVLPKATYDLLKSPMYATSIGLLIDGVQSADEAPEMKAAAKEPQADVREEVKSDGNLFEQLFRKTKKFIEDEVGEDTINDKDYLK